MKRVLLIGCDPSKVDLSDSALPPRLDMNSALGAP